MAGGGLEHGAKDPADPRGGGGMEDDVERDARNEKIDRHPAVATEVNSEHHECQRRRMHGGAKEHAVQRVGLTGAEDYRARHANGEECDKPGLHPVEGVAIVVKNAWGGVGREAEEDGKEHQRDDAPLAPNRQQEQRHQGVVEPFDADAPHGWIDAVDPMRAEGVKDQQVGDDGFPVEVRMPVGAAERMAPEGRIVAAHGGDERDEQEAHRHRRVAGRHDALGAAEEELADPAAQAAVGRPGHGQHEAEPGEHDKDRHREMAQHQRLEKGIIIRLWLDDFLEIHLGNVMNDDVDGGQTANTIEEREAQRRGSEGRSRFLRMCGRLRKCHGGAAQGHTSSIPVSACGRSDLTLPRACDSLVTMPEPTLQPIAPAVPVAATLASDGIGPIAPNPVKQDATRWSELSPAQLKSGLAAWLGWLFDGLDMHLYTIVAMPFVAILLHVPQSDPMVKQKSAFIQAAFLIGWALGGGFFGRLGDLIGRSKSLSLTILTYAGFTGLSFFAHTWWQLMIFRFVAALGIGGEWAVGSSLLSETWPKKWRPWIAAVLQTGVNIGVLTAAAAGFMLAKLEPKYVFLFGAPPALIVFWIRKAVPEPAEWHAARALAVGQTPRISDLFRGSILRITLLTVCVCAFSLSGWWGCMFWVSQHWSNLPMLRGLSDARQQELKSSAFAAIIGTSIIGNFFAGWLARGIGYRRAIAIMCFGMFATMFGGFIVPRDYWNLLPWVVGTGFFSGVFGLFTMYLPPLFPTLLRTTGAGFCYNIGRIFAAIGTVVFGLYAKVGDFRSALLVVGFLFLPAMAVAWVMPDLDDAKAD